MRYALWRTAFAAQYSRIIFVAMNAMKEWPWRCLLVQTVMAIAKLLHSRRAMQLRVGTMLSIVFIAFGSKMFFAVTKQGSHSPIGEISVNYEARQHVSWQSEVDNPECLFSLLHLSATCNRSTFFVLCYVTHTNSSKEFIKVLWWSW